MAKIGLAGFRHYVDKVLPVELEHDKAFAAYFNVTDHSRLNLGFHRWQMNIFSASSGIDLAHLGVRAPPSPRVPGIAYEWPELLESEALQRLIHQIRMNAKLWLERNGYPKDKIPSKLEISSWVEVFGKGEAMSPRTHVSGAYVMGRYWAYVKKHTLNMNFEDPRGINPPFGKTHVTSASTGDLVMHPTWASHFITPNMADDTAVCYVFLVYPPNGQTLSRENDMSPSVVVQKTVKMDVPIASKNDTADYLWRKAAKQ